MLLLLLLLVVLFCYDAEWRDRSCLGRDKTRKGTSGVSTNGVTAKSMFFDRGTFWVLPLTRFYFPKSARAYLFPRSVELHDFCSGPMSADPICPQPKLVMTRSLPTPSAPRGPGCPGGALPRDAAGRAARGQPMSPLPAAISSRHCKPAACILGLAGANMWLSLTCGFP